MGLPSTFADTGFAQFLRTPEGRAATVSRGPITNNITVQVAPTNASPQAIGEAAGNAVGSALRGVLGDVPAVP